MDQLRIAAEVILSIWFVAGIALYGHISFRKAKP
jgi:hypothetical protein